MAQCKQCNRSYEPEEFDFGICCICFRDIAYERVLGPNWKHIVKDIPNLQSAPDLLAACKEALLWLDNAPIDYSNGVVHAGYDEGNIRGWKGHKEITEELQTAIAKTEGVQGDNSP